MEMTALESAKAQAERDLRYSVAKLAAESMAGRREELVRATTWLNDFYRSPEGLQRPDGLWLTDRRQPDIEAIAVWIFDVYQTARIEGKSEEESRRAVANAIRATHEWREKHPGSN
jgi:plasmid stabilization system protein ParE